MVPSSEQLSREQAATDLTDIAALEKYEPFQRYFIRRLKQKEALLDRSLKFDEMTAEKREATRQRGLLVTELLKMMAEDRAGCLRLVAPATLGDSGRGA